MGLRGGGGLSDYLNTNTNIDEYYFYQRFAFDLLFFIIVNLILLGIFLGIIVDAFGDLRDDIN